jgi:8-oxo-dGTP pyrophosphatase MutT (NUDIX family)
LRELYLLCVYGRIAALDREIEVIRGDGVARSAAKMTVAHDSETPAHGRQVITACAFIHHRFDGVPKVFLPRRAAGKRFLPGVLELPGGHIDFGEDLVDGLKREIAEEFGMALDVGEPYAALTYTNPVKGSHSVEVIYFAQFADPLERIQLNPEDHSEWGWYTESELSLVFTEPKGAYDPEVRAIHRGFEILRTTGPGHDLAEPS